MADELDSSASFLSPLRVINKFISSIWKLFVFAISNLFLDKATATHRRSRWVMCCEDEMTYFRDFSKTQPFEGTVDCGTCQKSITLTPVPGSNVVVILDNSPDCVCKSNMLSKATYFTKLCNASVSQWKSDLSQQVCFDKLDTETKANESAWKCSADKHSWRRPELP